MNARATSWVPRPTRKHKRANKNSSRMLSLRRATPSRLWWLLTLVLFPFLPLPLNPSARILLCSGPTSCHVPRSKHEEHPLSRCQRCQRQPPMVVARLFRLLGPPKSYETVDFYSKTNKKYYMAELLLVWMGPFMISCYIHTNNHSII